MTSYPTNVSNSQWQVIEQYVDTGRKRKHSLRELLNAVLYVVKTGCQWRMLPQDFPKWQLVYYYYSKWSANALFDRILDKLRSIVRVKQGQEARASVGIMDSQSVRWGNNRSLKSYDGNKKVKGIKRHIVVDKNGFLLAVMVTVAHIHDSKAVGMLMRVLAESYHSLRTIIADGGYCGNIAKEVKEKFGYCLQVVLRRHSNDKAFKPVHKRWIVERTFAWMDNNRRLCRNYELLMENAEEMTKLAAIRILLNRI